MSETTTTNSLRSINIKSSSPRIEEDDSEITTATVPNGDVSRLSSHQDEKSSTVASNSSDSTRSAFAQPKIHPSLQKEKHSSVSSSSSVSSQPYCVYENPVHHSPKQKVFPMWKSSPGSNLSSNAQNNDFPATPSFDDVDFTFPSNSTIIKESVDHIDDFNCCDAKSYYLNEETFAKSDYISKAAKQITQAQKYEAKKEYEEALNFYKEGVGTLLQVVQGKIY